MNLNLQNILIFTCHNYRLVLSISFSLIGNVLVKYSTIHFSYTHKHSQTFMPFQSSIGPREASCVGLFLDIALVIEFNLKAFIDFCLGERRINQQYIRPCNSKLYLSLHARPCLSALLCFQIRWNILFPRGITIEGQFSRSMDIHKMINQSPAIRVVAPS